MRRGLLLALGTLALAFVGLAGSEGCRTPTQITVELRTFGDLPCASLKGVAIVVARTREDAEAKLKQGSYSAEVPRGICDPDGRTIGTLVVTPQDSTGAIIVRARISDDPKATCVAPDYVGCIVARRSFSFIDHASITLPIALEIACVDVPCDVKTSCRSGSCVSSDATCSDSSGTCESQAQPVRLPDGGSSPPDASLDDGPSADGPRDAPADAPRDTSSPDAGNGSGNTCPITPIAGGPKDCHPSASGGSCCHDPLGPGYHCGSGTGCAPGEDKFLCTGRKWCNVVAGEFCCGSPTSGASARSSSCSSCSTGASILCNTSADCPAGRSCSVVYSAAMPGGPLMECAP